MSAPPKRKSASRPTGRDRSQPRPIPATRKGKFRRQQLKDAAIILLRTHSYHDLTLEQITGQAGIPLSVFYHYFNSKKEVVLELLEGLFAHFEERVTAGRPYGTWERGVRAALHELIELHRANVGLMRCLAEVEEPEFAQRWRANLLNWRQRLASALTEFVDQGRSDKNELFAVVTALDGMTHTFIYDLVVVENPKLKKFLRHTEDAVEFLTTLWMRALFQSEPRGERTPQFTTLARLKDRDTQKP